MLTRAFNHAASVRENDQLKPRSLPSLAKDDAQAILDALLGGSGAFGDPLIGEAGANQDQDLSLTLGECPQKQPPTFRHAVRIANGAVTR